MYLYRSEQHFEGERNDKVEQFYAAYPKYRELSERLVTKAQFRAIVRDLILFFADDVSTMFKQVVMEKMCDEPCQDVFGKVTEGLVGLLHEADIRFVVTPFDRDVEPIELGAASIYVLFDLRTFDALGIDQQTWSVDRVLDERLDGYVYAIENCGDTPFVSLADLALQIGSICAAEPMRIFHMWYADPSTALTIEQQLDTIERQEATRNLLNDLLPGLGNALASLPSPHTNGY